MINILLTVDDIHPEEGFGFHDEYEFNLKRLIDAGIKPTLFVVPQWHYKMEFHISKHKEWIKSFGENVEWAIHGYAHYNPNIGRDVWQEFNEVSEQKAVELVDMARFAIKNATGTDPVGIRFPGWVISQDNMDSLLTNCNWLDYYALHSFGTELMNYKDKIIVPLTKEIHKLYELKLHHDNINIILHAHISPGENGTNENSLNDENTEAI